MIEVACVVAGIIIGLLIGPSKEHKEQLYLNGWLDGYRQGKEHK